MRWLLAALLALVLSVPALGSTTSTRSAAAHPCTLISNGEIARIAGSGGHVEVGGSACRIHKGSPMIGVITINPDTRARFNAFRRSASSSGRTTPIRGLGESAFLYVYPNAKGPAPRHNLFVLHRGQRLVVTAFGPSLSTGESRRIAAIVASRI